MSVSHDHVDLFAGGLGGFSWAGRALGYSTLGIEWDRDACATREAAGLVTLQADVSALNPLDFAPIVGLTGGPPCQPFSSAGKGEGRAALAAYADAITCMGGGGRGDIVGLDAACGDERAHLVLEPLRWALALRPRWVACEQVPPVLPLWEAMAAALRAHGYWTWTGLISAETMGVPQTRCRAFMLASLDGPVDRPPATHQRYIPPRRRDEATGGLFDLPESERIVAPEDRGLLPWVSMAEALNFGMTERPSTTVKARPRPDGRVLDGGQGAQRTLDRERGQGRWITGGHDHNERAWLLRAGTNANDASRPADEPAPTLRFGARLNDVSWVRADIAACGCPEEFIDAGGFCACCHADHEDPDGMYAPGGGRHGIKTCPAYVLTDRDKAMGWVESRPATTVNGDPRVSEPGHHDPDVSGSQQANAIRVSLAEALVLQSYDPDYPVQGSKSAAFLQVGNGIPLLLAVAVLRAVDHAD